MAASGSSFLPSFPSENSANDYKPVKMADQTDSAEQQALQLDFYQAMSDFRHMFPNMDEEVIEAVLRANNGTVDATIDQLLTMSVDEGGVVDGGHAVRARMLRDKKKQSLPPEFQGDSGSSSEGDDPWAPPPYPPPSYSDYTRTTGDHGEEKKAASKSRSKGQNPNQSTHSPSAHKIQQRSFESKRGEVGAIGGGGKTSLVTPHQPHHDLPPAPTTPMPPKMKIIEHKYTPGQPQLGPQKLYGAKWNPPVLGKLPEDFLRLSVDSARDCSVHGSVKSHSDHRLGSGHSSPHGRSPQAASGRSQRAPALQTRSSSELSSQVLQQRLAENAQKTNQLQGKENPERAQYLRDERLALCIQNEEFLWELQTDEDFMKTLQRDRMNATAFEPAAPEPKAASPELEPNRPKPEQLEGYGDEDRDKSLGAFPFDQKMPADENAEFRRQLNQMGGSSKKKFMAIAKNFFTRKKKHKSPKQILKQTAAPSTANLLQGDYEEDSDDDILYGRPTTPDTMEGSPFIAEFPTDIASVPTYKTVQRPQYNPDTVVSYHGGADEMV